MAINRIAIVGTGQGGYQAAVSLRQEGYDGKILLIGEEPGLPYQRPPLSKAYLKSGEAERLLFRGSGFYETNSIELRPNTRAVALDPSDQNVSLSDGTTERFDHLILALGARNRKLPIDGAELEGILELRTLTDAERLREHLAGANHIVVIGGGFIGLEVAASARSLGVEATVAEALPRLMARAVCEEMSTFFLDAHRTLGVDIRLGARVSKILNDGTGRASGVELSDMSRIDGDLVLVAAGIVPNSEISEAAGLQTGNGIVVDDFLSTSHPAISAIGDCASFPHRGSGTRLRLESVQNAVDQAKCVARRIVGCPVPYDEVAWFWSDQADLKLQIAGITTDADRRIVKEDVSAKKISVFAFKRGRFVGAETVNNPADHMAARRLLARSQELTFEVLKKAEFNLRTLL